MLNSKLCGYTSEILLPFCRERQLLQTENCLNSIRNLQKYEQVLLRKTCSPLVVFFFKRSPHIMREGKYFHFRFTSPLDEFIKLVQ